MLFTASIFIPEKPKRFDLTRSEKLSWYSLFSIIGYSLILLIIEKYLEEKLPIHFTYPLIPALLCYIISQIIRLTEFENLNGYFEGRIVFDDYFLTINDTNYSYSSIENLIIYGNSFSGEKTTNTRNGPMFGNGTENLISFTFDKIKIEKHFQLNSERHLDQLQEALLHIITNEKIPYQRKYLNYINEEHRSFMHFEFFIGKLIQEKRIECTEGLLLIGYKSDKEAKELKNKYCC